MRDLDEIIDRHRAESLDEVVERAGRRVESLDEVVERSRRATQLDEVRALSRAKDERVQRDRENRRRTTARLRALWREAAATRSVVYSDADPRDDKPCMVAMRAAFQLGLRTGITRHAWWKDGAQYVGTCGETRAEAVSDGELELKEWE